jgi:hypothetical protein
MKNIWDCRERKKEKRVLRERKWAVVKLTKYPNLFNSLK